MNFVLIDTAGAEAEVSGGCYGCIGRSDSYYPDNWEQVKQINDRNGHGTESYECDIPEWRSEIGTPEYLVFPANFYQDSITERLYHTSRIDLLDYLVNRSPYSVCFADGTTAHGIIDSNEVKLKADGVSSELVISLGYVLRRMCSDEIVLNWKMCRELAPELPEFLSLVLCYVCYGLYRGEARASWGYGDGALVPKNFSFRRIYEADPYLSGLSIADVGGYVMNVSGMWTDAGCDSPVRSGEAYNDLLTRHSGQFKVAGVFGEFNANGVKDIRQFLLAVNDLFKGVTMDTAKGLVAVYGSLRKGLHNHNLLEDADFLGTDQVSGFKMYSMGGFPFITHDGATESDTIQIEVYQVDPYEMRRLDQLEGYPSFYNRELIKTKYGDAWIYFIDDEVAGHPPVIHGDWFKYYSSRVA